jgi:hypothetical protein
VDSTVEKILVLVTANKGKNPLRLKHKVFLTTVVGGELAVPKQGANHYLAKGEPVNIQAPGT